MDDALLEMLSAYADGELDAAAAVRVEAALAAEPNLRRRLAAFRALEAQVAALPVPELDGSASQVLWMEIKARSAAAPKKKEAAQAAPALETGRWRELAADLPPVPAVSETRWGEVWSNIRTRTQAAAPSDASGRAAPLDADLSPVGMRVVTGTAALVQPGRRRNASTLWLATAGMAVAALLMAALTLVILQGRSGQDPARLPPQVADDAAEGARVLDNRYFMMVKHVSDAESADVPSAAETQVVCFFLKD